MTKLIKILIVDDEKEVRLIIQKRLLHYYNCWVDISSNVNDACNFIKRKRYDIIFFDYLFLDNIDGFDFLYNIKRSSQNCVTVMITGYIKSMEDAEKKGMGIVPDELLVKPFPENGILKVMDKYFPNQRKIQL